MLERLSYKNEMKRDWAACIRLEQERKKREKPVKKLTESAALDNWLLRGKGIASRGDRAFCVERILRLTAAQKETEYLQYEYQ